MITVSFDPANMIANELAFAIAALVGHAYTGDMRDALTTLIGKDEAESAIQIALQVIGANQL